MRWGRLTLFFEKKILHLEELLINNFLRLNEKQKELYRMQHCVLPVIVFFIFVLFAKKRFSKQNHTYLTFEGSIESEHLCNNNPSHHMGK
jgi:hypothetical protein